MATNDQIRKIYGLDIQGADEVLAHLDRVNKGFDDTKKIVKSLKRELNLKMETTQAGPEVDALRNKISQLERELVKLKRTKESEAQSAKVHAQALINEAKIRESNAKASMMEERQAKATSDAKKAKILADEAEVRQMKRNQQAVQALAGSYNYTYKSYRELYNLVKSTPEGQSLSFRGQLLGYDQAIAKLKELAAAEQAFRRQFQKDGTLVGEYTTGIIQAFKRMGLDDMVKSQVDNAKKALSALDTEFDELKKDLSDIKVTGQGSFETLERQMLDNRQAAAQLGAAVERVEGDLKGFGSIGNQITTSLKQNFKDLSTQITQFVVGYLSFQAAYSAARSIIRNNYELSDSLTDLQRVLGATDAEFESIIESLREIDTRTSLNTLAGFAFIAAKAGVATEQIAGVTKALDDLYLVAGKSLGDPEKTFESLVKLNTIFNDNAPVTADNMTRLGNAIIQLDNAGVASGQFIVDFAQRLAGIEGVTGIQIQSVLGLAAAFEENGASAEVAATAVSQVVVRLYSDTRKYAEIAKMTKEAFEDLLNSNPGEALLRVSEGLKGNAVAATEFASNFSELETRGVRVQAVMGTLAANTDQFREKMQLAGTALQDTAAIADGAAKKQENFAASTDKIRKQFELIATNKAFLITLSAISGGLLLILNSLPVLLTLLGLWTAGWVALNGQLVINKAEMLLLNGRLVAQRILLGGLAIIQGAYNTSMALFTGLTNGATAATQLFGLSLKALPIGWLLAIMGALAATLVFFSNAIAGTTDRLRENTFHARLNADVQKQVNEQTAGTISKLSALTKVVNDNTVSLGARKKALDELIRIAPDYLGQLTMENIKTREGKQIIDEYVKSLQKKAEAEALYSGLSNYQQQLNDAQMEEARIATDEGYAKKKYAEMAGGGVFTKSVMDAIKYGTIHSEQAFLKDFYQSQATEAQKGIDFFNSKISDSIVSGVNETVANTSSAVEETIGVRRKYLQDEIKRLEIEYDKIARVDEAAQKKNIEQRDKYQDELDKLDKKKQLRDTSYRGSRLDGSVRDSMKDIEAEMNDRLTALKTAYMEEDAERRFFEGKTISDLRTFLEAELTVNEDATRKKLARLSGANAEERRLAAELHLKLIEERKRVNDELYKLELDAIESRKTTVELNARSEFDTIQNDPAASDVQKAIARQDFLNRMMAIQLQYNEEMDALELRYNNVSKKNEADRAKALEALRTQSNRALMDITEKQQTQEIKEIEERYQTTLREIQARLVEQVQRIYNNPNLSPRAKQRALKSATDQSENERTEAERQRINDELAHYNWALDNKLISQQQYNAAVHKLNEDRFNNEKSFIERLTAEQRRHLELMISHVNRGAEVAAAWGNAFLQVEENNIRKGEQAAASFDAAEKKKRLARAESEQERDAIETEYTARAEQREREYARKRKEIAEKQLAIEFALASIRAISQGFTQGGLYGAIAAEAYVALEYGAKLMVLQSQQFEKGGKLNNVLARGGIFSGPSHRRGGINFLFGGVPTQVEGEEGFVINKNSMASGSKMTATGTPAQIASAANVLGGGVNFAPGAITRFEYGGHLGSSVRPPVFSSYFQRGGMPGSDDLVRLERILLANSDAIVAVSQQVRNIKVELNPHDVSKFQNDHKKAVTLGTL